MVLLQELPVYKASMISCQFTKDFSKEYEYTVGESLKKEEKVVLYSLLIL